MTDLRRLHATPPAAENVSESPASQIRSMIQKFESRANRGLPLDHDTRTVGGITVVEVHVSPLHAVHDDDDISKPHAKMYTITLHTKNRKPRTLVTLEWHPLHGLHIQHIYFYSYYGNRYINLEKSTKQETVYHVEQPEVLYDRRQTPFEQHTRLDQAMVDRTLKILDIYLRETEFPFVDKNEIVRRTSIELDR